MEIKTINGGDIGLHNVYDAEIKLYLQLLSPYNSLTAQVSTFCHQLHELVLLNQSYTKF